MSEPVITLTPESIDNDVIIDFLGEAARDSAWLTVNLGPDRPTVSVVIIATDEGIVVDLYPVDEEDAQPVGSTYVLDADLTD